MYVRLAFAINIMSQPDIMVVDEALAVGDMNFQAKCITALKRRQEAGTTVLFVSHDIRSIKSLCSRGIYLEQGQLKSIGTAAEVAERYIRTMREEMSAEQHKHNMSIFTDFRKQEGQPTTKASDTTIDFKRSEEFNQRVAQFRYGTGEARITYVELLNSADEPIILADFDQSVKIRIYFQAYQAKTLSVNFNIVDDKKIQISGTNFLLVGQPLLNVELGDRYRVEYGIRLPLQEGNYALQVALTEPVIQDQTANFLDYVDDAFVFTISRWEKARVWSKVYLFPSVEILELSQE
jgi:lipopolysaccharide transport system ATP-binding protein